MDVVLPYRIKNEQKFFECAFKLGFDEFSLQKFLYMFHQSDVDTFPKMGDDRIALLIYGWELCEDYRLTLNDDEWELPEEIEMIIKILMPWSLDIWFSKEWDRSKIMLRYGLIHCLNRARSLLMRSPDMMQINWEFLLLYNQTPWHVSYLKSLTVKREKTLETGGQTIEMEELPATCEGVSFHLSRAVDMDDHKEHFHHILLFYLGKDKKAPKAHRDICDVYRPDALIERKWQKDQRRPHEP